MGNGFAFRGAPGVCSGGFVITAFVLLGAVFWELREDAHVGVLPASAANVEGIICFPEELSVRDPTENRRHVRRHQLLLVLRSLDATCLVWI